MLNGSWFDFGVKIATKENVTLGLLGSVYENYIYGGWVFGHVIRSWQIFNRKSSRIEKQTNVAIGLINTHQRIFTYVPNLDNIFSLDHIAYLNSKILLLLANNLELVDRDLRMIEEVGEIYGSVHRVILRIQSLIELVLEGVVSILLEDCRLVYVENHVE